jgi:hypothetical protein
MKMAREISTAVALGMLFGCAEEPQPPSVDEFMSNNVLRDATMIRCGANRSTMKYEVECVNAREANNRIAVAKETERRAELEAQSERKRRALRRTQEAANLARKRAAEAAKRREEQAYISQFTGESGGSATPNPAPPPASNGAPQTQAPAVLPEADPAPQPREELTPEPEAPPGTDLQSIRDELKRRQESGT